MGYSLLPRSTHPPPSRGQSSVDHKPSPPDIVSALVTTIVGFEMPKRGSSRREFVHTFSLRKVSCQRFAKAQPYRWLFPRNFLANNATVARSPPLFRLKSYMRLSALATVDTLPLFFLQTLTQCTGNKFIYACAGNVAG